MELALRYPFRCKDCGSEFDLIMRVSDYEKLQTAESGKRITACTNCKGPAQRFYTPHEVCGADDWNNQTWNQGLGCYTKSNKHARDIAKSKGLIEVGNEKTDTIHKEFDTKREEKRQERWDNALKDPLYG